MRVIKLVARQGDDSVELAPNAEDEGNWITIITGANGTRKSIVLRLISSTALGASGVRIANRSIGSIGIKIEGGERINRVIAISGTPFDRFAKFNARRLNSELNEISGEPAYTYFGFKSINGATGAVGISRVIGSLLWKRRNVLGDRYASLNNILEFLNLEPEIEVKIRRPPSLNASSRNSNIEGLKRGDFDLSLLSPFLESLRDNFEADGQEELQQYVLFLLRSKARMAKLVKFLSYFPSSIHYNFLDGETTTLFPLVKDFDIERIIDIGLLVIDDLFVARRDVHSEIHSPKISASSLSSGQWQLLLGMLGLGLEVQDNTIIVIDEPENSLHPEWQRQYIELLEKVISARKGCHTIIATHSPLITSGVNGQRGNIIRLVPDPESRFGVESEALIQNFGWDVSKTLELLFEMQTTRGSGFVEMVDSALALIRDNEVKSDRFICLAESIILASKNLPKGDPALQISQAIGNLIPKKRVEK